MKSNHIKTIQCIPISPKQKTPQYQSQIGGLPNVVIPFEWPKNDGKPLDFLASIKCFELPKLNRFMPTTGVLFFFVDTSDIPTVSKNAHRVIYQKSEKSSKCFDLYPTKYTKQLIHFKLTKSPLIDTPFDDEKGCIETTFSHLFGAPSLLQYNPKCDFKYLEEDPKDWILLFQLISEYESNMNFVDDGILYFYIKKDDLRNHNFNNTRMFFQFN